MGVLYKMSKDKMIDHYGFIKFHLELEEHGTPAVINYEDTNLREKLIDADEIMIDDKKISISFTYPLSVEVMIECEKEDGFSRMDLFKLGKGITLLKIANAFFLLIPNLFSFLKKMIIKPTTFIKLFLENSLLFFSWEQSIFKSFSHRENYTLKR